MIKLILLILLLSCNAVSKDPLVQAGFDGQKWQKDSLCCENYRARHYQILLDNKDFIQKQNSRSLYTMLGNPNLIRRENNQEELWLYDVERSIKCDFPHSTKELPVANIYILVSGSKVERINLVIP